MTDERLQEIMDHYKDVPREYKPIIETGRKALPLSKFPQDLDFSKTIGGTTYIVKSHFNKDARECLFAKTLRLLFGDPNLRDDDDDDWDDEDEDDDDDE